MEANNPGEDRVAIVTTKKISIYLIADGHGGEYACDIAKEHLCDIIVKKANNLLDSSSCFDPVAMCRIIDESFIQCDEMIVSSEQERITAAIASKKYIKFIGIC